MAGRVAIEESGIDGCEFEARELRRWLAEWLLKRAVESEFEAKKQQY